MPQLERRFREFWDAFIRQPIRAAHDEREISREDVGADRETIAVLLTVAVVLTLQNYIVPEFNYVSVLNTVASVLPAKAEQALTDAIRRPANTQCLRLCYWAVANAFLYVVIPALVMKFVCRRSLSDYGVKFRGAFSCWWIYAVMYLGVLPCVLLAARRDSFQTTYPFYQLGIGEPLWPRFLVWQAFYAMQFVALEFFFRGFMLHGTKRRLGPYAVLVMSVVYCMIHFGKPMPETFAAIIAGILLGLMSLKTRSIWMGAALHIAVAWSMDSVAIWQRAS